MYQTLSLFNFSQQQQHSPLRNSAAGPLPKQPTSFFISFLLQSFNVLFTLFWYAAQCAHGVLRVIGSFSLFLPICLLGQKEITFFLNFITFLSEVKGKVFFSPVTKKNVTLSFLAVAVLCKRRATRLSVCK